MTNRFSTPRLTFVLCALAAFPFAFGFGCAKVDPSVAGVTTGGGGSHGGTGSNTGTGNHGAGGGGVVPDSGVGDGPCQQRPYTFTPKIPNVLVFVDGSGSMFDPGTGLPDGRWGALRSALLPVIMNLQSQVNFGLAIFSGVIAENACPIFQTVAIGPNNYDKILASYPAARLRPQSVSLETPLSQSLPMIPPLFAAAPKTGASYVLFATDGEPDFCDNDNAVCPVDAAVAGIKQLFTQNNITTYVMGLSSDINASTCPDALKAFAAAGQNQPVANPCGVHVPSQECTGRPVWAALRTALGRTAQTSLVDYVAGGSTTKVFQPNIADQQSLTDTLAAAFSGVKSCTFDLNNPNGSGDPIKVDTTQLDKVQILVCPKADPATGLCPASTTAVPLDNTNGWHINCVPAGDPACKPTQLEFTGSTCTNWRLPDNNHIDFNFPCGVIIPG